MFFGGYPRGSPPKARNLENAPIVFSRPLPHTPAEVPTKLTRNGRGLGAAETEAGGYRLEGTGPGERGSAPSLKTFYSHGRLDHRGTGWLPDRAASAGSVGPSQPTLASEYIIIWNKR